MIQGAARKGVLYTYGKDEYTESFHKGEFLNILYALEKGLYSQEGINKLKIRFRGPQWKPVFDDMIRLGYFSEQDRDNIVESRKWILRGGKQCLISKKYTHCPFIK